MVSPRRVVINLLDCDIVVNEFKLQSRYSVHLFVYYSWERYETPYPSGKS